MAIRAKDRPLRALVYAGRPLHEAVVARGPFVMNTEAEIEQAYADYRAGRFGPNLGRPRIWACSGSDLSELDQIDPLMMS